MHTCLASSRAGYHAGCCTCLHVMLHVWHVCELPLRLVCIRRLLMALLWCRIHIEITHDWTAALKTAQVLSPMYELVYPKVSGQASHGVAHACCSVCIPSWCPSWCREGLSCDTQPVSVQVWLAKGLHAAAIAKIAHLVEDWEATKSAAATALQQLRYTHIDTSMYQHLQHMMVDAANQQADGTTEDYL